MLEFAPNTYMLEYQDGVYLCNGTKRVEALLNYTDYQLVAGERVTKSKFWIYAEQGIFHYRYLMRLVEGKWMVDNAQWCQEGRWSFCGL